MSTWIYRTNRHITWIAAGMIGLFGLLAACGSPAAPSAEATCTAAMTRVAEAFIATGAVDASPITADAGCQKLGSAKTKLIMNHVWAEHSSDMQSSALFRAFGSN